jgi:AcrR family transcriptional regulator
VVNESKLTKIDQSKATIHNLLMVATQVFSQEGYAAASTEKIVRQAGVTRGALYHHFKNKKDLFLAVFKEAQREIGRRIESQAEAETDLWKQLVIGCRAFLEACSDPVLQQIVVIDAPSVLNWSVYREVDAQLPGSGLSLLKECLTELIQSNIIRPLPVDALAHLLSGAMDEAAVWIAQSPDPKETSKEAQNTLETLLTGLRLNLP